MTNEEIEEKAKEILRRQRAKFNEVIDRTQKLTEAKHQNERARAALDEAVAAVHLEGDRLVKARDEYEQLLSDLYAWALREANR